MEQVSRGRLQVEAFGGRVGRQQDPSRGAWVIEEVFHLLSRGVVHPTE